MDEHTMKTFIMDGKGAFMNGLNEWGPKEEAYDLETPAFAVDLCLLLGLRNVYIALESPDPRRDVVLKVQDGAEFRGVTPVPRKESAKARSSPPVPAPKARRAI